MGAIYPSSDSDRDGLTEFIGLLYQKYSDPISFLNTGHETVGIFKTVLQVYIDKNNQQLWDLYIHFKPEQSFIDWKNSIGTNSTSNCKCGTPTAEETEAIINDADSILKGFTPSK